MDYTQFKYKLLGFQFENTWATESFKLETAFTINYCNKNHKNKSKLKKKFYETKVQFATFS